MNKNYYLGIDVGGTKVEGALALLNTESHSIAVLSKKRIPSIHNVDSFIDSLVRIIHDLINDSGVSILNIRAIGIGLPGSLDPNSSVMLNGNTQFLIGVDIIQRLQSSLSMNLPIIAENDANLFTLAEAWGGVGQRFFKEKSIPYSKQVAVGVTLGTGVGGGLVALGRVLNGAHGSAMEVGHISLNPEGPECYCGQRGCAETYLSGTALNKLMDSKELFLKARESDSPSSDILKNYRKHMLHFLSILNNLFNPHYFVFGGGLSNQQVIFNDLEEQLSSNIFLPSRYSPPIYINELGDSAGLFGAMIHAHETLSS